MACNGSWCFLVKWKSPLQGTYIISWSTSALRFQPFFECLSGRWDIHETAWPLQQIPRFRSQHRIIRYSQHRISKPPEGPQFSAVLTWKCGLVMFSRPFFLNIRFDGQGHSSLFTGALKEFWDLLRYRTNPKPSRPQKKGATNSDSGVMALHGSPCALAWDEDPQGSVMSTLETPRGYHLSIRRSLIITIWCLFSL